MELDKEILDGKWSDQNPVFWSWSHFLAPCFPGEADVLRNVELVGLSGHWSFFLLPSGPGAVSLPCGARCLPAVEVYIPIYFPEFSVQLHHSMY